MAGDWIKMTHALPEKPEVLEIAGRTSLSRFEVVGRLFTLWRWFDTNTVDGNARGVTKVTLNECLFGYGDATNFVSAVVEARWLSESADGIGVVKFDEHISESAKTRAQTAKRVAKSKAKTANAEGNGVSVTKTVPREEKRRGIEANASMRGTRLPKDFEPTPEPEAEAGIDRALELAKFHDFWASKTGKDATKLDWQATWRNWARNARRPPGVVAHAGANPLNDPDSVASIQARAAEQGIGPWDEMKEQWHVYKARVLGRPVVKPTARTKGFSSVGEAAKGVS